MISVRKWFFYMKSGCRVIKVGEYTVFFVKITWVFFQRLSVVFVRPESRRSRYVVILWYTLLSVIPLFFEDANSLRRRPFIPLVSYDVVIYTIKGFEWRHRYRIVNSSICPFMSIPNISVVPVSSYHWVVYFLEWLLLMRLIKTEKVRWVSREVFGRDG